MFRKIFARKLSSLIKSKNMTNQDLANYLNVTRQSVSQFTRGTAMPSTENLIAIADFFNISIDELLGRKNIFSAPNTTNFDSNRTVFNLLNNPDGILEYKIFVPTIESQPTDDGRLLIDLSSKLKKGKFKYSFALIKHYSIYRSYLILDEIEGNFIKFVLEKSKNKDNFISLVNIINQQLGLNYDAYNYNRVALVIKIYDEHYYDFHLNVDLSVPVPTVSKLTLLKEKYINAWLELPIAEKIQELKRIYEKELGIIKKESFV